MSREKWTDMKVYEEEIITLHEAGKTRQETAKELGLRPRQIKDFLYRYNRRIATTGTGLQKSRGRKPTVTLQEYKYENKRLKMENELLRDFLHLAGRK